MAILVVLLAMLVSSTGGSSGGGAAAFMNGFTQCRHSGNRGAKVAYREAETSSIPHCRHTVQLTPFSGASSSGSSTLLSSSSSSSSLSTASFPVVTLKIAVDKNGAVDDLGLAAKRFTSAESLDAVHRLRRDSDAVLVGVSTVVRDDPSLTVRRVQLAEGHQQPLRVVLDPTLRIPPSSVLLRDGHRTAIFCSQDAALSQPPELAQSINAGGAQLQVTGVPQTSGGRLDLLRVLEALGARGVRHLMVEGGPLTSLSFLEQRLVDRVILIRAPVAFSVQPVPSNLEDSHILTAGLRRICEHNLWAPDSTSLWLKEGAAWPTPTDPSAWP